MTLPNIPMRDPQSWKGHLWVLTPALIKMVMAVMVSGQHSTTLSYRKRPCLRKQKQNRSSDMVFSLSAGSSPCKNHIPLRYRMVFQTWRGVVSDTTALLKFISFFFASGVN